jgi:Na+-translocating ferredoxin:NAD+ oxidoreductase RnfD subunit
MISAGHCGRQSAKEETVTERTLQLGGRTYPLVLPSLRDPRLHVAAVIISVHVLGQVGLHFQVSVPQILAAILTCAGIEMAITFARSRAVVWPASAMLTGSGVALILRLVGTPADEPWHLDGWPVFAAVAGFSLLTKYVVRYRGVHLFNPSNVGLVVAFLVLGSATIEPLDFWWAPLGGPLLAAYAVILVGGTLITRRLGLLELGATFWLAFAAGLGILAASGHCMTARWAFAPVCGADFWRVVVTSPEVLIFLFFMITDPRTVPAGRVARIVFGLLVAALATLLIAPQPTEFGAKVGLLASLVLVCAARPVLEAVLPAPRSRFDDPRRFAAHLLGASSLRRSGAALGAGAGAVLLFGVAVVAAGTPARGLALPDVAEVLARAPVAVDPSTLPPITVRREVADWDHELAGPELAVVVRTLAENLDLESQALLRRDPAILAAVDHGDRLAEMEARLRAAEASGRTTIERYRFDSLDVSLLVPFGVQTGLSLGLTGTGTVTRETYDGRGNLVERGTESFHLTFAMRRATGARWLIVGVLPPR